MTSLDPSGLCLLHHHEHDPVFSPACVFPMKCWKSSDKVLLETSMNHHSNRSMPGADRPLHSAGLHRAFALSFLPCKVPKHSMPCSLKLSQSGNACRERAATISLWSASRRFCAALSQPRIPDAFRHWGDHRVGGCISLSSVTQSLGLGLPRRGHGVGFSARGPKIRVELAGTEIAPVGLVSALDSQLENLGGHSTAWC